MDKASERSLAGHPGWLALGHYRPNWYGDGVHSLIDSPAFFLADRGKYDPEAELEATLRAFSAPPIKGDGDDDAQHPQCAYKARYGWLKEELGFDPARLPEQPCPAFEEWSGTIDADAATLIFPAAYMNNPASMFGHTLLRLDRAGQSEDTRLLSYAVNYGAETGSDNGLLFAVLGLTGGYAGTYSVAPYHELTRRYSDIENRDIYEYRLNFTPAEVARMVEHLWEMQGRWSEYYFFDENCSYQLLFLMDVARPSLDLASAFDVHVIPVESVRAVLGREGLFQGAVFRPSGQTRIREGFEALTPEGRALARDLAEGALTPESPEAAALPPAGQAAAIELAQSLVTYRMETGDLSRDVAAERAWALLAARSRIEEGADLPPIEVPATRPDQGHDSARFGVGLGLRDGRPFAALRLRPAYHDDLDPSGGYVPGAGIDFLAFELRHYDDGPAVTLERLTGVGIRSMTPRTELLQPISWWLNAGIERLRVRRTAEEGALIGVFEGGAGLSYGPGERDIWSATLDLGLTGGEDCDQTCSVNAGPAISLLWPITDHASLTARARYQLRFGEKTRDRWALRFGQSFGLGRGMAVRLEAGIADEGGGAQEEVLTWVDWYF